jgi:predicted GNAT family acetyltransferase
MELWIGLDVEGFSARAEDFVTAVVGRNVLATVLGGVHSGRYAEAVFAVVSDARGETVAAALRTPPHDMLATGTIADPDALIAAWLALDPSLSGVSAETDLARSLAGAWVAATGGSSKLRVSEGLHRLERVIAPEHGAPGVLRRADWRESAQLGEWGLAFGREAGVARPEAAQAGVEHQIAQGSLYVWESAGQTVTLIGHTDTVAGSVRIGPVYTPAELRGHGYATAATAALSQRLLDGGAERCLLYTDVANPISNHIYAKIGYVRIADWEEITFCPGPG